MLPIIRFGLRARGSEHVETPVGETRSAKEWEQFGEVGCKCLTIFPGHGHVAQAQEPSHI